MKGTFQPNKNKTTKKCGFFARKNSKVAKTRKEKGRRRVYK